MTIFKDSLPIHSTRSGTQSVKAGDVVRSEAYRRDAAAIRELFRKLNRKGQRR